MDQESTGSKTTPKKNDWKLLYRLGGLAAFIVILLFLFQMIFIKWSVYPKNIREWYELFIRSRVLGLFYLNTLDILSAGILGVMFTALCAVLSKENKSLTTLALPFAFLGIAMFIIPRAMLLSFVSLSARYQMALSGGNIEIPIAAGSVLGTLAVPTLQTTGFFIMSTAAFLISLVMVNSNRMPRIAGFIGVLAFLLTVADNVCLMVMPSLAVPVLVVAQVFWLVWWTLTGIGLLKVKD